MKETAPHFSFIISGNSIPEDPHKLYAPVLMLLDSLRRNPLSGLKFIFDLNLFNTSSTVSIQNIIAKIDELYQQGIKLEIEWHYRARDEDTQELGEEYADETSVPFKLVEIED